MTFTRQDEEYSRILEANKEKFPLQRFDPASGKCGKPLERATFNLWFSCVLDRGHTGDCKRGGTCPTHGPYIGKQCAEWPDCLPGRRNFNR